MRKTLLAILLVFILPTSAFAGKAKNLDPTNVTLNGDGTVVVSTTATSHWCSQRSNGGGCNIRITNPDGHIWTFSTFGDPTVLNLTDIKQYCPCQAQFWEHAGQWHSYSALSGPFIP